MKAVIYTIVLSFIFSELFAQNKNKFTYSQSEITLETSTGNIYGTLTVPNDIKTFPLVLIIAGSGPTDRDCNNTFSLHTNAYKMLSDSLIANGIATLRFDKRGVGKSKPGLTSESELRFEMYINDIVAWISLIKSGISPGQNTTPRHAG